MARYLQLLLAAITPFVAGGATCARTLWPTNYGPPAPQVLTEASTLEQVIAAVNDNSARVNSFQTNSARISAPGVPTLNGNIAIERPRRIRLRADTPLTGPEVDLGSNDEEFWFWVRRSEPPAVYFCRHDQFGGPARKMIPIDPDWLIDALGLPTFSPQARHSGPYPQRGGKLEVRSAIPTPEGELQKITVVDAQRGWVLEQHVYGVDGKRLASAVARNHRYDPGVGVSLPGDVDVQMPAAQLNLKIELGDYRVNSLMGDPMQLFARPVYPGYNEVNLAGFQPQGAPAAVPSAAYVQPSPSANLKRLPPYGRR